MAADYVVMFNNMVPEANAIGLIKYKQVKRFADTSTAVKRIDAISRDIAAKKKLQAEPAAMPKSEAREIADGAAEAYPITKVPPGKRGISKKKKVKIEALTLAPDGLLSEILGTRVNTNKGKLLAHFIANKEKPQTNTVLLTLIYGNANKESAGKFQMVIGGLQKTMEEKRVSFIIERSKNGKEMTYAFRAKK